MKRTLKFSSRNFKEVLRDPINLFFGLGFPLVLLILLSVIQSNIPSEMTIYNVESLAPALCVFGYAFIALFSGTLVAGDMESSFAVRLYSSPMKPAELIAGYALPMLALAAAQSVICLAAGLIFGLTLSFRLLLAVVVGMPAALFFAGVGLLTGSLLGVKQVGGVCGALLTNLAGWLSGTWFDLALVGGVFEKIANLLPFVHAVNACRAAVSGDFGRIMPELAWVFGYAAVVCVAAAYFLGRRAKGK